MTNPVPEGFHAVTPHLTIRDCEKAIDFYRHAIDERVKSGSGASLSTGTSRAASRR